MTERTYIKTLGLLLVLCLCLAGCKTPGRDGQPGDNDKLPQEEQLTEKPKTEEKPEGTASVDVPQPLHVKLETAKGDIVIILSFALLTPEEAKDFKPKIAVLDENNKIKKQTG